MSKAVQILVQEEFEIEFDGDCIERCSSFDGILARVTEAVQNSIPVESGETYPRYQAIEARRRLD